MTTGPLQPEHFRVEIRRLDEDYETYGFFETKTLAEPACEDNIFGTGDYMVCTWTGPNASRHWAATAAGATYRITREAGPPEVGVMGRRVFLSDGVRDDVAVPLIKQAERVSDVAEVVDLPDVDQS
jgi:hypothetical protein